jgi:heme iron utilization protein
MAERENTAALPGIMPDRLPETARPPEDFNPIAVAKQLLRGTRAGALATIDRNTGHPFSSLVNVATDADGSPLILVSRLSTHTANIEVDPRASVLLASTGKGDPLAHPRLTILGTFANIFRDAPDAARVRRRFLSRHPKSALYASFGDFTFWRLKSPQRISTAVSPAQPTSRLPTSSPILKAPLKSSRSRKVRSNI